jgi:hypothetical protein
MVTVGFVVECVWWQIVILYWYWAELELANPAPEKAASGTSSPAEIAAAAARRRRCFLLLIRSPLPSCAVASELSLRSLDVADLAGFPEYARSREATNSTGAGGCGETARASRRPDRGARSGQLDLVEALELTALVALRERSRPVGGAVASALARNDCRDDRGYGPGWPSWWEIVLHRRAQRPHGGAGHVTGVGHRLTQRRFH